MPGFCNRYARFVVFLQAAISAAIPVYGDAEHRSRQERPAAERAVPVVRCRKSSVNRESVAVFVTDHPSDVFGHVLGNHILRIPQDFLA